jgi:hypothetical protein
MIKHILCLLAFLGFFHSSAAWATGFSHVQGTVGTASSGTLLQVTLPSSPTAGNTVACGVSYNGTAGAVISSFADANGNSYAVAPNSGVPLTTLTSNILFMSYLLNAPANASNIIKVTFSSAMSGSSEIWCDEFSVSGGTVSFDLAVGATGISNGTLISPSLTPTGGNELLYATCLDQGNISSVNAPWTQAGGAITSGDDAAYDLSASATTTVSFQDTATSSYACMQMAFKFSGGGGGPSFGFNHVQGASGSASSGTTVSVTLPATPAAGDLVACAASFFGSGATTMTAKDSNNNSYVVTPNSPSTYNGAGQFFNFYLLRAPSNVSSTIQATFGGTITGASIWCDEFSYFGGAAAFDTDLAGTGSIGTAVNTPSLTPAGANELFYAGCADSSAVTSANSPWTIGAGGIVSGNGVEYDFKTTSGALAVAFTQPNNKTWSCVSMAFKLIRAASSYPILQ